jgi:hypothetical protein
MSDCRCGAGPRQSGTLLEIVILRPDAFLGPTKSLAFSGENLYGCVGLGPAILQSALCPSP